MACDNLLERAFMARIRADEYREALLGKAALDDCCEVEVKDLGATVEYVTLEPEKRVKAPSKPLMHQQEI